MGFALRPQKSNSSSFCTLFIRAHTIPQGFETPGLFSCSFFGILQSAGIIKSIIVVVTFFRASNDVVASICSGMIPSSPHVVFYHVQFTG
uniref:Uncharacterized protein n=1 Tax=Arundo donax TaxID=35708 RepID=A0A0A9DG84_ARUDO